MTDSSDRTNDRPDEKLIAVHEAAHAVVQYRAAGFVGGDVTIVENEYSKGSAKDYISEDCCPEHIEGKILSCYAGCHAMRLLGFAATYEDHCWSDDDIAVELLDMFAWRAREAELRQRSLDLVRRHWAEILAVTEELVRWKTLEQTEVEIIIDIAAGDAEAVEALPRYRALIANSGYRRA